MKAIPVVGFSAYSGAGKTTLIERLVIQFKQQGLRVAVIKHDGHEFEIDREGKDSWRYTKANADLVVISSGSQSVFKLKKALPLAQILSVIDQVDLILVEGYKHEKIPQIGLSRTAHGAGLPYPPEHYRAIVTDESLDTDVPVFALNDIQGVARFIMEHKKDFTHFDPQGNACMVNVEDKEITRRRAQAGARVYVNEQTYALIESGGMRKGDVLAVAQVAGIMGAKRTPELIPMCHSILLDGIQLSLALNPQRCCVEITATVSSTGRTGVEMEALTAASTAALTVYDMCKAVQKDIVISDLRLLQKSGGVHGDFTREED